MSKSTGKKRFWTEAEMQLLTRWYADVRTDLIAQQLGWPVKRVLAKANALGLHKSRELIAEMARERTNKPGHGSHAHRIKPGSVPHNKGVKRPPGWSPGNMAKAQFKPGARPHTWVPVGSYRIVDGQLQRKVNDDPGPTGVRWFPVSRLVWEAAHGPVPKGRIVVFRAGQHSTVAENITLDALECITRRELIKRNSVHTIYPPELARLVQLRGALNRKINRRLKEATP
jgi:hypothetical protein